MCSFISSIDWNAFCSTVLTYWTRHATARFALFIESMFFFCLWQFFNFVHHEITDDRQQLFLRLSFLCSRGELFDFIFLFSLPLNSPFKIILFFHSIILSDTCLPFFNWLCYYVVDIFIVSTENPVSPFAKRPDDFISTLALLLWFDVVKGFHSINYLSCCTWQMHMVHPLADLLALWLCEVSSEITPVCLWADVW